MEIRFIIWISIAGMLGGLQHLVGLPFIFVIPAAIIPLIIYGTEIDKKATVYILNTINKRIT